MNVFKNANFLNLDYISPRGSKPPLSQKIHASSSQVNDQNHQQLFQNQNLSYQQKQHLGANKSNPKSIIPGKCIQPGIDFGVFNQFRLDEFFQMENNLDQGNLIPIVSVSSHALHLQEKFLNFLQKYHQFELIFIGVYGQKNSGKSLFLDKILNLATFQGSHFTQTKTPKSKKQICLWSIPISRGKQRIFLVDCTGFGLEKNKQREDEMLCDFFMFLCSQIILIQPFQGNTDQFVTECYQHIKNSMNRMHFNKAYTNKESFYWPESLTLAYRNPQKPQQNPFKKIVCKTQHIELGDIKDHRIDETMSQQELKNIKLAKYADRKKKMLSESYLRCASECVKSFYDYSYPKFYDSVKPNGNGFAALLMNFVLSGNCKDKVNVNSVIQRTVKEILAEAYNTTVKWYSRQLEKQLKAEQPKNSSQLLTIFEKTLNKTFKFFSKLINSSLLTNSPNSNNLKQQMDQMQEKLQSHIRQKQVLIKKINEKKTHKYLKQLIDKKIDIKQMPMQQILELRQILYKSRTIERKLDANRLECLKTKMIEGWNKFIMNQEAQRQKQISDLEVKVQTKKEQLKRIKEKNYQQRLRATQTFQKFSQLNKQQDDVSSKMENLKFEINIRKKAHQEKLQNSYDKIHLTSKNQQDLLLQLKEYQIKLTKRHKDKTEELKLLREELQQAYKIESQQINKNVVNYGNEGFAKSNPPQSQFNSPNSPGLIMNINAVSQYELGSKEKTSWNNLPSEHSVGFFSRHDVETPQELFSSRIARNTESIRLMRNLIDQRMRAGQELEDKIASSYVNLSRINMEYKNNQVRASQSRQLKIVKSQKKLKRSEREEEVQTLIPKSPKQQDRSGFRLLF